MKKYHELLWDDRNVQHIAIHQVSPDEVEDVVFSPRSIFRRGRGGSIYYVFGQTYGAGRYLFCVLRDLGGSVGRVITSREMTHKEKRWYSTHRR